VQISTLFAFLYGALAFPISLLQPEIIAAIFHFHVCDKSTALLSNASSHEFKTFPLTFFEIRILLRILGPSIKICCWTWRESNHHFSVV
jgi:hypothetical protein